MKKMLLAVLLMSASTAFASEGPYNNGRGGGDNTNLNLNGNANRNHNSNRNSATGVGVGIGIANANARSQSFAKGGNAYAEGGNARQNQRQHMGQAQQQRQHQKQLNDQRNKQNQKADNDVSVSYNEEGDDYPVSTAWAPPTMVTAPCMVGVSAGGQIESFGVSLGGHYMDEECVLNRTYVMFATNPFTKDNAALLHGIACQMNAYRTASASLPELECPEYVAKRETALRPISDSRFGATTQASLNKRKCHIADEDCY